MKLKVIQLLIGNKVRFNLCRQKSPDPCIYIYIEQSSIMCTY